MLMISKSTNNVNNIIDDSKIIYKDELFTFTTDDIYFLNNEQKTIFLDVSKYFDIYHSFFKINVHAHAPKNNKFIFNHNANANMRKLKLICLGSVYTNYNLSLLSDRFNINVLNNIYNEYYQFKLIPDNAILNFGQISLKLTVKDSIGNINKNLLQNKRLKKIRNTDRKYRSSHNSINIKKHIHNIRHKVQQSYTDVSVNEHVSVRIPGHIPKRINKKIDEDKLKKYSNILDNFYINGYDCNYNYKYGHTHTHTNRKFKRHKTIKFYKGLHTYKKARPLTYISGLPVFAYSLENIIYALCDKIQNKTKYNDDIRDIKFGIMLNDINDKLDYKFIRLVYVLTCLRRYDDAALLLINKNEDMLTHNTEYPIPNVNDIHKKTLNYYKDKFNMTYYNMSKYTYTSMNMKIKTYTNTNTNTKDSLIDNNLMNNNITDIVSFIVPKSKETITTILEPYKKFYNLHKNLSKNLHDVNKQNLYLLLDDDDERTGLLSIKQKF